MKILIIPAWYPLGERDLTASFIREQAHALHKRGHKITVIFVKPFSFREIKDYFRFKKRVWNDDGIVTYYYGCLILVPIRFENLYHKYFSWKYYQIIKKAIYDIEVGRPDLIHSHVGPWCSYFVIPAAKRLNLPIVTTEHYSGLTNGTIQELKFQREKYVVDNSDLTIFVGSNLQKKVLNVTNAKGNTTIIPNQINSDMFCSVTKSDTNNMFRFITACHLVPLKKVENVINAFHKEFNIDEKVEYVIAGDGVMRTQLEHLVKELGETDRIHFIGEYSREEMPSLFSKCNAFVLTSEFETFGIVYIEAMMCGLPCIGTKGQGSDDIIDSTNGLSVEFGDLNLLQNAMRFIYKNIDRYDYSLIRAKTIEKFSEDTICNKLKLLYLDVIKKC